MATSRRPSRGGDRQVDPLDARAVRATALDTLARRDHASPELRRKLLARGFDAVVIDEVIGRLMADRVLDDRRYAEQFIEFRAARGQGPLRVRAELQAMGLAGDLVEEALNVHGDWIACLRGVRQKKFGAQLPADYAERQRQARFLSYRGFTGAQIRMALGFDTEIDD